MDINRSAPVTVRRETVIAAPPDAVWAVHTDVDRWPRWHTDITGATLDGPLAAGSHFIWKSGPGRITSVLIDVEPPRRVVWTGRSMGVDAIHTWTLEATDEGTRVVTEESLDGWPVKLIRRFFQRTVETSIDAWLAALKTTVEERKV